MLPKFPYTYFIDRCLGDSDVPNELRLAGARVEVHSAHFKHDEQDRVWLPMVGERGWVVLTKDRQIRTRPLELQAVIQNQVALFALTPRGLTGKQQGVVLVEALADIERRLEKTPPPFIATISAHALVTLIYPEPAKAKGKK